mgnify:CR=1 FL=1
MQKAKQKYDELSRYTWKGAWPHLNLQVMRDKVIPLIEEINLIIKENRDLIFFFYY